MPVTLAQAQLVAPNAIDVNALDEFRESPLLDALVYDDIVSPTGGDALAHTYNRVETTSDAAFRAINAEYAPTEATISPHTVYLKPLGGSFQVDRVISRLGAGAANTVAFQMSQKIKAARAKFADAVINGDTAVTPDSFDGLKKALAGSDTEVTTAINWSGALNEDNSFAVLETLDDVLGVMDGEPTIILSNKAAIAKIKGAARRTAAYTETPGPRGTSITRYGSTILMDAGVKPGTNNPIIPVVGGNTQVYAIRVGLDGFHVVSTTGPLLRTWLPDFGSAGAVKTGEVELGPLAPVLRVTKAAAVATAVKVA